MAETASPLRALRTGFTTGACAAAAARAAARALLTGAMVERIGISLPNGQEASFAVSRCERGEGWVRCGVVKDAGDDPDVTHGAEILAEVSLTDRPGVELRGGRGVATVTRPGLGLEPGEPAINPVPRRNISEMVRLELAAAARPGAAVIISVPDGERLAALTLNPRLGLLGGISILGTTGIVRPFSTAAWRVSVVQAIDVALAAGLTHLALTTGGRTERFAMALLPELAEPAFIQAGDDVGLGLRHAARGGAARATVVAMVGKLAKMAAGELQTHVSRARVDGALLAELAAAAGAGPALAGEIARANTARHALELADAAALAGFAPRLCRRAAEALQREAGPRLPVRAVLVDFEGAPRATFPLLPERP
ncbi:MAG TPA: cobalt-precorrin-5B (C(1))-methyltransferase [Anaeromyxobacteraceae bacterium]|jgi:cobalt-precorrin-5B (C1)-methyltransferase|nr:cobalt-precorrin-5B (C(1))-methyltransferase [Anaeromyxobacteraceae bacterium]